jgi:hypothetical protein
MLETFELTRMQPTNGRKSSPQVSGLYPLTTGQHSAGPVHPRPFGLPATAEVSQGTRYGDRGEHQVDVEGPAPREVFGEHPAEEQAHGAAAGGDEPKTPKAFPARAGPGRC